MDEEDSCLEHIDAHSSDVSALEESGSSEAETTQSRRPRWRSTVAMVLAVAATAATVFAMCQKTTPAQTQPPTVSRLLMDGELHQTTTEQMCPSGQTCHASVLTSSMHKFLRELREKSPKLARELDTVEVTPQQRAVVLAAVRHARDPRIHALGLRMSNVINEHAHEGLDAVNRHVTKSLQQQGHALDALRTEISPNQVSENPKTQLNPSIVKLAGKFDNWDASLSITLPESAGHNAVVSSERRLFDDESSKALVWTQTAQQGCTGIFTIVYAVLHHTGSAPLDMMSKGIAAAIGGWNTFSRCKVSIAKGLDPPLGPNYLAACVFEMLVLVVDCLLLFLPATGAASP